MSKREERSDERKPFDSRRTKAVTLVTPRNPAPAPPSSASVDKGDAGQSDQKRS